MYMYLECTVILLDRPVCLQQCYHGYIYVLVLFQEMFPQSQSPKGEYEGITLVSDPADF